MNLQLGAQAWVPEVNAVLAEVAAEEPLRLRAVVRRRGGREVLVALRQVGEWSNVRTETGEVLPGREDDWTLLLFHDGGNAVDATAGDLVLANALADAIGSRLWGAAVRYEPIRRPLRERDLRRLLEYEIAAIRRTVEEAGGRMRASSGGSWVIDDAPVEHAA